MRALSGALSAVLVNRANRAFPLLAAVAATLCLGVSAPKADAQTVTTAFYYTGANQSFIVPTDVTSVFVELWGGGGAGFNNSGFGGGGGFVSGTISVTANQTLTLLVGRRGIEQDNFGTADTFSGAGRGLNGGGGRSGLIIGGTEVLTAGGGGGGGAFFEMGGAGGGLVGGAGTRNASSGNPGNPGSMGGTQTEGGAGIGTNSNGSFHQGGGTIFSFGGGGGGYYGGGADSGVGSGGGGSSFFSSTAVTGGLTIAGVGATAGNATSADYVTYGNNSGNGRSVGSGFTAPDGPGSAGDGGNGLAIVRYTFASATAAPEPGSLALLLPVAGVVGMVIRKRRRHGRCASAS